MNIKGVTIQWGFPVDNPEDNWSITIKRGFVHACIPTNSPDIHKLTIADMLDHPHVRRLLELSRTLNRNKSLKGEGTFNKDHQQHLQESVDRYNNSWCNPLDSAATNPSSSATGIAGPRVLKDPP